MLENGTDITVEVQAVAFGGFGVARFNGVVVFIPQTADGDVVRARVVSFRNSYAIAAMLDLLRPSPRRTEPFCKHFGVCGGCAYQHMEYSHQLRIKEVQFAELLRRAGGLSSFPTVEVFPSPQASAYRLKADFHLAPKNGATAIGFMKSKSNDIVEIEVCAIVSPPINAKLLCLRQHPPVGMGAGKRITLWESNEHIGERCVVSVKGKCFVVPENGFFQANTFLLPRLVDLVMEMCGDVTASTVVDAYCGSGLFSCFLGGYHEVIGIEGNREALACAQENFSRLVGARGSFYAGDCGSTFYARVLQRGRRPGVVIVDPPRSGCDKNFIALLASLSGVRVVYVSCNPATLARDLRILGGAGFVTRRMCLLDMFPQCSHIESVTCLEKP